LEKETKKKFRVVLTCDPELRDKIFYNGKVCDRFSNCGESVKEMINKSVGFLQTGHFPWLISYSH